MAYAQPFEGYTQPRRSGMVLLYPGTRSQHWGYPKKKKNFWSAPKKKKNFWSAWLKFRPKPAWKKKRTSVDLRALSITLGRPVTPSDLRGLGEHFSGIMDFTGVQAAIDYVKAKVGAFFQLPYEYTQAKKKLPALMEAAKRKGDNTAIAKLTGIEVGVNTLQAGYPTTEKKVKTFLDSLNAAGLGFIPLVVAGAAIVVGGAVAYQLVTWGKLKTELNAIESGLVKEGFFSRPLLGLGGMGMILPVVAIAGAGLWFLMRKK